MQEIWRRNSTVPLRVDRLIHDLITEQALTQPESPAIHAHDGDLTYAELDAHANQLSHYLSKVASPTSIVPLAFEKSMWTAVAVLAVLKSGCSFVLLDVTQPQARLRSIITQTKASVICSSVRNRDIFAKLIGNAGEVVGVGPSLWRSDQPEALSAHPRRGTDTAATCYLVFTSGSTGTPKGVALSHSNLASAFHHQLRDVGFNSTARVFDFASYSFDVSVHNLLATLVSGGCLCVPSDRDRLQDTAMAMTKMKVTLANLTPSVACLLDPARIPTLETTIFLGETLPRREARKWQKKAKVVNTYGPAEATPISTINNSLQMVGEGYDPSIGSGVGLITWVVDPTNHDILLEPGEIGELLLEGPLVSDTGYLNDPGKTTEAFIPAPSWLLPLRQSRLYKTGDLVRYDKELVLHFFGRKDTQIKRHGQRIELGEIEHHVQSCIPDALRVVAEQVMSPMDSLVVFVQEQLVDSTLINHAEDHIREIFLEPSQSQLLATSLPNYMLPNAYFSISRIPQTSSGKVDRRRLRDMAARVLSQKSYTKPQHAPREPASAMERTIHKLWAKVSDVSLENLHFDVPFMSIGGDSLMAMRLATEAQKQGILLPVADIFRHPTIEQQAKIAVADISRQHIRPFTLNNKPIDLSSIAVRCNIHPTAIADVYPCTPLQEGLISLTMHDPSAYILKASCDISKLDLAAVKAGWEQMYRTTTILRTRIIDDSDYFDQVVVNEDLAWQHCEDVESLLSFEADMKLGGRLSQFILVGSDPNRPHSLAFILHHALYDAWSLDLMFDKASELYTNRNTIQSLTSRTVSDFNSFIAFMQTEKAHDDGTDFWCHSLADSEAVSFPAILHSTRRRSTMQSLPWQCSLPNVSERTVHATVSVVIRATLALLLAQYTQSNDVIFGATVSGRSAALPSIDSIIGPTIATVPIRIRMADRSQAVSQFLSGLQEQATHMIAYEQNGLQNISRLGPCNFQTLLVVQPDEEVVSKGVFGHGHVLSEEMSTYSLTIECILTAQGININARFDPEAISEEALDRFLGQFEYILGQLVARHNDTTPLRNIDLVPERDIAFVTRVNTHFATSMDMCIHQLIQERQLLQSESRQAICSWDGTMTYCELLLRSKRLANHLTTLGVRKGALIPICFEKTMLVPVAMLALLQCGAAFVPLEPSLPSARRNDIIQQSRTTIILTSEEQGKIFETSGCEVVRLTADFLESLSNRNIDALSPAQPDDTAYIIHTSGTTGQSKGVVLQHKAVVSSCIRHGEALGFNERSRVLQFSSYSFDACIAEILTTLLFGGCICIPSSEDRLSNLEMAINRMNVNWMFLTPAVARLINPDGVNCVQTIAIGGERFPDSDAERWIKQHRRVILVYGPTETCVYCTYVDYDASTQVDTAWIGRPIGSAAWIVDPNHHDRLAPVGTVGELCIEGPILARGYLNDEVKTSSAFIEDPAWIARAGRISRSKGPRRMYKTGDLVQYASLSDGTLRYVSRKGTQVKIHGQRLELSDVELHVQQSIPDQPETVAEVVSAQEDGSRTVLIAFTRGQCQKAQDLYSLSLLDLPVDVIGDIKQRLPAYMVPSYYVTVAGGIPRLASSGKTDRKWLREAGQSLLQQHQIDLAHHAAEKRQPSTDTERRLRKIWAGVLSLPETSIGLDDNFYSLGGDSIRVISLVSEARRYNIGLTVSEVFMAPTLAKQASSQSNGVGQDDVTIEPFKLLPNQVDRQTLAEEISGLCSTVAQPSLIEDVYPCSALQEGLISLGSRNSGDYMLQNVLILSDVVHLDSFKSTWDHIARVNPILRTRVVHTPEFGLLQAVLQSDIEWTENEADLQDYLKVDKTKEMDLGQPLCRFAILTKSDVPQYFVWTIHHAIYDGWMLRLLVTQLDSANDWSLSSLQPFNRFIDYVEHQKGPDCDTYWREELREIESSPFPPLPPKIRQPVADAQIERSCSIASHTRTRRDSKIATSAVIRAALAVVMARYTGSHDVVFGATLSGRNAPIAGISGIVGPTIATVPIRIRLSLKDDATVEELLHMVQQQSLDMIPHEQAGLQYISRVSEDARTACQFQTLLVIQTDDEELPSQSRYGSWVSQEQLGFSTYALTLQAFPSDHSIRFQARFDSAVISPWKMEQLLNQICHVTQQLASAVSGVEYLLSELGQLSDHERTLLHTWNSHSPNPIINRCVHSMVMDQAHLYPSRTAVEGHDGTFTYQELDTMSDRLAEYLVQHGVGPEVIVPLCFPKSSWTILAIFGVLKTGGAFVLLDPSHPADRLRVLCEKTSASIALASPMTLEKITLFVPHVAIVDSHIASWLPSSRSSQPERGIPESTAYVIFTSGSTGVPKGCKIEHRSYCSASVNHGPVMTMSSMTRTLQFGSYSFAGAIMEILMTLIHGGCVCVPSDEERTTQLDRAICRLNANWAFLTSSVLSSLNPDMVPCLRTVCVGGEAVHASQISLWSDRVHLRQTYGSAETSAVVSSARLMEHASISDVGNSTTGRYWIVDCASVDTLAPLGAVGECIIEGPTIGREYLDEPAKTAAAFIQPPLWRSAFGPVETASRFYRTGDLAAYTPDGGIQLLGRKESTQVKLRGQRIELGEIEHQSRAATTEISEIAVELAHPGNDKKRTAMLVAFFVLSRQARDTNDPEGNRTQVVSSTIQNRLMQVLPQYMVPSVFLPLPEMPRTISKKTDRRQLREMASAYSRQELIHMSALDVNNKRQPSTMRESELQQTWARLLGIDANAIGIDDDFWQIGGDSVSALQLVAETRRSGLSLSMSDIFQNRTLAGQAQLLTKTEKEMVIAPFSLLSNDMNRIQQVRQDLSATLHVRPSDIEDVYPCTPLQLGMLSLTLQREGDYMLQNVLRLSAGTEMQKLITAWKQTVSAIAILRTRIVYHDSLGLMQVVIRQSIDVAHTNQSLPSFLAKDKLRPMDFSQSLSRFTIIGDPEKPQYLVWTVHHALYDGWSLPLLLSSVNAAAQGIPLQPRRFAPFIKYIQDVDPDESQRFWTSELAGCEASPFPPLPSPTHKPTANHTAARSCSIPLGSTGHTPSSLIRAAVSILLSKYSNSSDVLFGAILSGRNAPIVGMDQILGPTLTNVPIRVKVTSEQLVSDFLDMLEDQETRMIPFEQTGLQNISRMVDEGTEFQTLLVIQPEETSPGKQDTFGTWVTNKSQHGFTTYGLSWQISLLHSGGDLGIDVSFDGSMISPWLMDKMLDQFEILLHQLVAPAAGLRIADVNLLSPQHRQELWDVNKKVPRSISLCVHEMFRAQAARHPDAIALSASIGEFTYSDLDTVSDNLAKHLTASINAPIGTVIPLCFEKSAYTVVAMLGLLKAGFGVVTFDVSQPFERLRSIVDQLQPPVILSSVLNEVLARQLLPAKSCIVVAQNQPENATLDVELPAVSPAQTLCILFTSGTTSGVSKGAIMTHSCFATAIEHQAMTFGHGLGARIFSFASYSFDISWFDTLHALASGSTLCIPTEEERKNDLEGAIHRSRATAAFLTPSVARLIHPEAVPNLRLLALGGEPQRWSDFSHWPATVKKLSVYGPAECTVVSAAENAVILKKRDMTLPRSIGLNAWLVDLTNDDLLAPLGSVGEIWLEGPLVGKGYIGDEKRTKAAFVRDPIWLQKGGGAENPGRGGNLYRTGDLARITANGTMVFAGRRDNMVKLRGQRVELTEVEDHLRLVLDGQTDRVLAEVVNFSNRHPTLVAFLEGYHTGMKGTLGGSIDDAKVSRYPTDLTTVKISPEQLDRVLEQLPSYMVPQIFFRVDSIPRTVNGKTDRARLRQMASRISIQQLADVESSVKAPPTTAVESTLQKLCAEVLCIEPTSIGIDDNLFRLGADSITAMKVVGKLRNQDMKGLTVADIFKHPTIRQLGTYLDSTDGGNTNSDKPVAATAPVDKSRMAQSLMIAYNITGSVENLYPCTPLQEGLLSLSMRRKGDYVMQSVLELSRSALFSLEALRTAWDECVRLVDVLRTRIVNHETEGLLQLVLQHEKIEFSWIASTLDEYLAEDKSRPMLLGEPLSRLALVEPDEHEQPKYLVWTAHHAIYDGFSLPLIMGKALDEYVHLTASTPQLDQQSSTKTLSFEPFVTFVDGLPREQAKQYWMDAFSNSRSVVFPDLPLSIQHPQADQSIKETCRLRPGILKDLPFTVATLVRTALARLICRHTGARDAVFGTIVSGRNAPIDGIERIAGPTITTVPVCIPAISTDTVSEFLSRVQQQSTEMIPFEQFGLQNILKATGKSGEFQTLLVIQSAQFEPTHGLEMADYGKWLSYSNQDAFTTYALTVECFPEGDDIHITALFDSNLLTVTKVRRLMAEFSAIINELAGASIDQKLSEFASLSNSDKELIWDWTSTVPAAIRRCVHDLIINQVIIQPDAVAICAHDAELTYSQFYEQSKRLSQALLAAGVSTKQVVPLCFEKSAYAVVSLMAVMLTGAAFVYLDPDTQPEVRMKEILDQVNATVICSSRKYESLARRLTISTVVVAPAHTQTSYPSELLPLVHPGAPLYVVFTSGSTGRPKGVVLSHENVASMLHYQATSMRYTPETRCYDFASYSFDVAIHNALATLSSGGCLLVPSDHDRKSRLARSMEEYKANHVSLTTSVARIIEPIEVPSLKTIMLGGEPVTQDVVDRWWGRVKLLNSCGPAECTSVSVLNTSDVSKVSIKAIGRGVGTNTWVVHPEDHNILLPIGSIGELCLEGPNLGLGYLTDPEKTNDAFIHNPPWLLAGSGSHPGRRNRIYKTGDLVRYDDGGSLHFVGRKDFQVKIRGQRIELEEVEHHLRQYLLDVRVAAEVVYPSDGLMASLVVFVSFNLGEGQQDKFAIDIDSIERSSEMVSQIQNWMATRLPPYMIPSTIIPVTVIPLTATNKTDRRKLKALVASLTQDELYALLRTEESSSKQYPRSQKGIRLQELWAKLLEIPQDTIGNDDDFFRLGGNSIDAMKLVGEAYKEGILLTVADIFERRTIAQLSEIIKEGDDSTSTVESPKPFSLLQQSIRDDVLDSLDPVIRPSDVDDILPLTNFQQQIVNHGLAYPVAAYSYFWIDLGGTVDQDRLKWSCRSLMQRYPLLSSVFVPSAKQYWQVALNRCELPFSMIDVDGNMDHAAESICKEDSRRDRVAFEPPTRFTLLRSTPSQHRLVIRLSHAQYDGIALAVIIQSLADFYHDKEVHMTTSFGSHLTYQILQRRTAVAYWKDLLRGSRNTALPLLRPADGVARRVCVGTSTSLPSLPDDIPVSLLVGSAWAFILSLITEIPDVVFGHLVSGRDTGVQGVQTITGPCVSIVPIRVNAHNIRSSPKEIVRSVQEQLQALHRESLMLGWEDILISSTDWEDVEMRSMVQHQNIDEHPHFQIAEASAPLQWFDNDAAPPPTLGIASYPDPSGLRIEVRANSRRIGFEAAGILANCVRDATVAIATSLEEPLSKQFVEALQESLCGIMDAPTHRIKEANSDR